ncbi:MAG: LPS-assembly protein LptD, partial [Pseudomonadota bacterium]
GEAAPSLPPSPASVPDVVVTPAAAAPAVVPATPTVQAAPAAPAPKGQAPTAQAPVTPAPAAAPIPAPKGAPLAAPQPVVITADQISGRTENETRAAGNVLAIKADITLTADQLSYAQLQDEVDAQGNVVMQRGGSRIEGPHAKLQLDEQVGFFESPRYRLVREPDPRSGREATVASGQAERIEFQGENHYRLLNATYSTCQASNPDWYAQASDLKLDYDNERAEGKSARVVFKDVPILAVPWLDFSLNDKRKSGLLAPTIGSSNRTGFDYSQPIYWDIAPNMDATFTPRLITKRGVQLASEFRYLGKQFDGTVRGEYLPEDQVTGTTRDALFLRHKQDFGSGFSGSVDFNSVSDGLYFSDLSSRVAMTSQANLLRQGQLAYGAGWWGATLTVQRYQTLQDPAQPPATAPYERLPQLLLNATRPDLIGGMTFYLTSEATEFSHPTLDEGRRLVFYPQIAWPLQTAAFSVTPKIGLHQTEYSLDRRTTTGATSISRSVPIFSVDTSLVFERDTLLQGREITQTLEPRLYYVRIPYRDQSAIPVFDSGRADFSFAQMFSENIFAGSDRIADANQITAAITSRAINPATGAELMRATLGQRYYFSDQVVTLPGVAPRSGRTADLLAALSGKVSADTTLDLGWQYNPRDSRTERYNLGARFQPAFDQVFNVSYRFTRDAPELGLTGVRDLDVSMQWPLSRGWYGLARYDYSLRDSRVVEALAGVEYDGGCWALRLVGHRLATATDANNTAIFVQLELNGFSRIGSNPLEILKRNIGGYGVINQPAADPVFGR